MAFDAKVKTYTQRKAYATFLRNIKALGYKMWQKSVYVRYTDNSLKLNDEKKRLNGIAPPTVSLIILSMPYCQYEDIVNINCEKLDFYNRHHIISA